MTIFSGIFGKKRSADGIASPLGTDMHSHILPGIDDGAKSKEDSFAILRELIRLGYKKFIFTPHIMADSYPNTPDIVRRTKDELLINLEKEGLNVECDVAAEYYMDEVFLASIGKEELLSFGGTKKYVLVESSYVNKSLSFDSVLFRLQSSGYTPVLAHPERYHFWWGADGLDAITNLAEGGIKMQVNIGSFAGSYHVRAGKIARALEKAGVIDFLGTDIHRVQQVESLERAFLNVKEVERVINSGRLFNKTI